MKKGEEFSRLTYSWLMNCFSVRMVDLKNDVYSDDGGISE
jgi:hypothetical protein